jgi:phosphoribosylformimino-5-aminoimidazole carboxamide ribotide isomerase
MELYPAIDLRGGRAVRLVQGDFNRTRHYGDPLALARRYMEGGATWIHVVDLDAARTGVGANRGVVLDIAAHVDARIQVGGGLRTVEDAASLLDGGISRVVLGTAALETPEVLAALAARYPGRVAVGLDHRRDGEELAVRGWERAAATTVADALDTVTQLDLGAVVVTAIDRDGMLGGPDLEGLRRALVRSAHPVVASGGVRSAADLAALARLDVDGRRLAGAVVGTALVEGTMTVEEAVAACVSSV